MSAGTKIAKKIFLIISTIIVAIACVVYLFVIFDAFEYRQEMAQREIGDEIVNIHKGVPRGWSYSVITDKAKIGEVGSLGQALAQVDFSLPELNAKIGAGLQKKSIYFYPRTMGTQIEAMLADEEKLAKYECRPQLYHSMHSYIVLTTSCSIFARDEYQEFEEKLKKELLEYWFQFQ